MNKKQRKILEDRKKELKKSMIPFSLFCLSGLLACLTIIGIPIGFILILIGYFGVSKRNKEIKEIEFKLAERK